MNRGLKKILLVEDDPDIQLITRLSLEVGGGSEVRICATGGGAPLSAPAFAPDPLLPALMVP
ncbi:MAG: hypothetical protein D4R74_11215, partial [Betaproteobacteria bacterium]